MNGLPWWSPAWRPTVRHFENGEKMSRPESSVPRRMVCIPCAFGRISDFRPQMTFFDPVRWPRMTSRCTSLNSEENFQPNGMHIMCISLMAEKKRSDHCFDHKWSISGHSGTFLGRILYISRISSLRRFEWYPFQPLAEKSVFACRSLVGQAD